MNEQVQVQQTGRVGSKTYKRSIRNILIHKPLQREYLFVIIALLMVSTMAIGFVIHSTIKEAAFGGGFHFGKISPFQVLSDVSYSLVMRVTLILFATLIILAIFGMSFLHRVAGPVYRFRQVLRRLNMEEHVSTIQLREGDFFVETAEEINSLIRKTEADKKMRRTLQDCLERIMQTQPGDPVSRIVLEIQELIKKQPAKNSGHQV